MHDFFVHNVRSWHIMSVSLLHVMHGIGLSLGLVETAADPSS